MTPPRKPDSAELSLIKKYIRYCPETGELTWKERPRSLFNTDIQHASWNRRFSGKKIARTHNTGNDGRPYIRARLFERDYLAHRIAWYLHYGEWPSFILDHINGDGMDNRISNIRASDHSDNMKNKRLYRKSKIGIPGVYYRPKRKSKWSAMIRDGGTLIHLGAFSSLLDAAAARKSAEISLGFSTRHGT